MSGRCDVLVESASAIFARGFRVRLVGWVDALGRRARVARDRLSRLCAASNIAVGGASPVGEFVGVLLHVIRGGWG